MLPAPEDCEKTNGYGCRMELAYPISVTNDVCVVGDPIPTCIFLAWGEGQDYWELTCEPGQDHPNDPDQWLIQTPIDETSAYVYIHSQARPPGFDQCYWAPDGTLTPGQHPACGCVCEIP